MFKKFVSLLSGYASYFCFQKDKKAKPRKLQTQKWLFVYRGMLDRKAGALQRV
jgi:hypothetical protein